MTGSANTYKFKLQNKRTQDWMLKKRKELISQLEELNVKVNKPYEMDIEQLEMLVNHHRITVESRKTVVSDEQMEIAESNGLTGQDVIDRVDDLNWDIEHAVSVKSRKEERRIRNQNRVRLLQEINRFEDLGESEKVVELEKMLVNL